MGVRFSPSGPLARVWTAHSQDSPRQGTAKGSSSWPPTQAAWYPAGVKVASGNHPLQKRFARFLGVLWRHSPFLVLLVLAALLRGLAWYAIHPGWWILGDSISYLCDAVQVRHEKWRPSGYSLLLLRPLLPVHRLSVVTGVQHVMGLLVAVGVYVTLLRFSNCLRSRASSGCPSLRSRFSPCCCGDPAG